MLPKRDAYHKRTDHAGSESALRMFNIKSQFSISTISDRRRKQNQLCQRRVVDVNRHSNLFRTKYDDGLMRV